ncbi:MAG TPA: tetratricopeptide repeat protein [Gaiellaceae bacterium]|nr:tetratricopeptide repeat protein [Gaiellaceae bacterium]
MSGTARLSDLALQIGSARWAMVRTHFGIQAFGVNAWVADEAGGQLIGEHDELGQAAGHHEELYFVSEGHATFTVDGDEIDAPAGTFVFVRDPAAKRSAVARQDATAVVVVGGKPGEAFTPSPWERNAPALADFGAGDYDKAAEAFEQLLAETPDDAGVLYNLACAESLSGKRAEALGHLKRSLELDPDFRATAEKDSDFDAIRDEPEFVSAVAGQPDASGSSA